MNYKTKLLKFTLTFIIFFLSLNNLCAGPFSDIKKDSWEYNFLNKLSEKKYIEKTKRGLYCRFEIGLIIAKLLDNKIKLETEENALFIKLITEYTYELDLLDIKCKVNTNEIEIQKKYNTASSEDVEMLKNLNLGNRVYDGK